MDINPGDLLFSKSEKYDNALVLCQLKNKKWYMRTKSGFIELDISEIFHNFYKEEDD